MKIKLISSISLSLILLMTSATFAQNKKKPAKPELTQDQLTEFKADLDIVLADFAGVKLASFIRGVDRIHRWNMLVVPEFLKLHANETDPVRREGMFFILALAPYASAHQTKHQLAIAIKQTYAFCTENKSIDPAIRLEIAFAIFFGEWVEKDAIDLDRLADVCISDALPLIKSNKILPTSLKTIDFILNQNDLVSEKTSALLRAKIREAQGKKIIGAKTPAELKKPVDNMMSALDKNDDEAFNNELAGIKDFMGEAAINPLMSLYESADTLKRKALIYIILSENDFSVAKTTREFLTSEAGQIIPLIAEEAMPLQYRVSILNALAKNAAIYQNNQIFEKLMQKHITKATGMLLSKSLSDKKYAQLTSSLTNNSFHTVTTYEQMRALAGKIVNDKSQTPERRNLAARIANLFYVSRYDKQTAVYFFLPNGIEGEQTTFTIYPAHTSSLENKLGVVKRRLIGKNRGVIDLLWKRTRSENMKLAIIPTTPTQEEIKAGVQEFILWSFAAEIIVKVKLDKSGKPDKISLTIKPPE